MKAIKLVYGKQVTRRSFDMTSMAPELFSYAEEMVRLSILWLLSRSR